MQVKIFEGNGNNESDINEWLKSNPKITVILVSHQMLQDHFKSPPNDLCNEWIVSTVVYMEVADESRNQEQMD